MTSPARYLDVATSWRKKKLKEKIIRSGLLSVDDASFEDSFVHQLNRNLLEDHEREEQEHLDHHHLGGGGSVSASASALPSGYSTPSSMPATPRQALLRESLLRHNKDQSFRSDGDFQNGFEFQNFPLTSEDIEDGDAAGAFQSFTSVLSDSERKLLLETPQQQVQHKLSKSLQEKILNLQRQRKKSSFWQTVFNIVNLYVGLGLLSKPYALRLGGWLSLAVLAFVTFIFCLTGKMVVWCFEAADTERNNDDGHASLSYLGGLVFGKKSKQLISAVVMTEFFGALCMSLIIVWNCVKTLLPQVALKNIVLGCTAPVLLTLLVDDYAKMAGISIFGFICNCLLVLTMTYFVCRDPYRHDIEHFKSGETNHYHLFDLKSLPLAVGIFIVSLAGHASLPTMQKNMQDPHQFNQVLNVSFTIMLVVYSLMAIMGYYYFADWSKVLITSNIDEWVKTESTTFGANSFEVILNKFVVACVALASFSSIGPLISIISDTLEDAKKINSSRTINFLVRMGILSVGTTISRCTYGYLGYFESILGGVCSISISLLLPLMFYKKIFDRNLSPLVKKALFVIIVCIFILIAVMFSTDIWVLIEDVQS